MVKRCLFLLTFMLMALFGCGADQPGAPVVTIKLGGKFCESYSESVKTTLQGAAGVREVDITTKHGHAVVTGDPKVMSTGTLKNAVDGVKGEGWYCEAEIVD